MPTRFSHLDQAVDYLLTYSPEKQSGQTYTLGRMRTLMRRLGNPQDDIPAIHVAGTSGKTSTCYYARALLQSHGIRTGLTASPHITSITERVQIDGHPLDDDMFMRYLEEFLDIIEPWSDIRPTYFELLTAFAFWVFKKERVEWMVVEVGLGGLLDATNVISSEKVCVITPIGLDHTQVLGDTISQIARQKAGIITEGSAVFVPSQHPDADAVIRQVASDRQASLHVVDVHVPMPDGFPMFQARNFALAQAVVAHVARQRGRELVAGTDVASLMEQSPPGRFEVYDIDGKQVVLDGAHNPQKLAAFLEALHARFAGPFTWVVGFISAPDSKIDECARMIVNVADGHVATQFTVGQDIKGRRSVSAGDLSAKLNKEGANTRVEQDPETALRMALEMKQRTVVVTGSLYLVAALRPKLMELAATSP